MGRLGEVRGTMRRNRDARRELLTSGERAVGWLLAFLPTLLTVGGLALLVSAHGAARGVGIGLLILALILMAVPVSPLLRARVRRREARALGADPGAVMDQLDHTDASFTLRVYGHGMRRDEESRAQLRELVGAPEVPSIGQRLGSSAFSRLFVEVGPAGLEPATYRL